MALPLVYAAQVLETVRDQVLILSEPDETALPAETADRGEIYQGSDRSYRGFYKVVLKKKEPGEQGVPQFGWIPVDSVRSADPAHVAALSRTTPAIERSRFSAELGVIIASYAPTELQSALGLSAARVTGTGFSFAGAYRPTPRFSLVLQDSTFGIPVTGTSIVNFSWSGNQIAGFLEYDVYRAEEIGVTLGLGGGWLTGHFQAQLSSGAQYVQPSVSAGFWNPRISFRWSFQGPWSAVLRLSRQLVAETPQDFHSPSAALNLSSTQLQVAVGYAF